MVDKLADCGTADYLNCYKGLKTLLEKGGIFAMLTKLNGPLYKDALLPSSVFKLLASHPDQFRTRLGADVHTVTEFWRNLFSSKRGMEFKATHPILRNMTIQQLSTMIPLRLHEDAGPFTKMKGVNLISWSSLLGRGTELESKHQTIYKMAK